VSVSDIAGKIFRLAGVEFLLDQRERIPPRQFCAAVLTLTVRPRGELGTLWDDAEPLLVGKNLIAQLLPAHIELAFELVSPLRLWLVWRVSAPGHIINEERLVGRRRVQAPHILDGLVRHVGGEVVAGLANPWKNRSRILIKVGRPLVGLTAHEPVEIL